jgi:hypothetical protein
MTVNAKEFLIAQIAEQAHLEGVPLSKTERKMLDFSETEWTLPDTAKVIERFQREHDDQQYEKRISRLIRAARKRAGTTGAPDARSWSDAIATLRNGDHYLLVLVDQAAGSERQQFTWRSVALAVSLLCVYGLAMAGLSAYFGHDVEHDPDVIFFLWATAASLTAIYLVIRFWFGGWRVDSFSTRVMRMLFRPRQNDRT